LTVTAINTAGRKASSQAVLVDGQPPEGALPNWGPLRAAFAWPRPPDLTSDYAPRTTRHEARNTKHETRDTQHAAYHGQHLLC
jgi:hypothetical protein